VGLTLINNRRGKRKGCFESWRGTERFAGADARRRKGKGKGIKRGSSRYLRCIEGKKKKGKGKLL